MCLTEKKIHVPLAGVIVLAVILCCAGTKALAAETYNMLEAVEKSLNENFRIISAQAGLAAGESGRRAALGDFGPSLGSTYGMTREEHVDDDAYTWRIALSQNVFAGFSTLASYQKAILQKDNAEAGLTQARINLVLQVQQTFLLYLKAEENVRSALGSYNRLAEQLKITQSFYDVGLRPRVEVLQAEVNVSEAEDLLLQNRNQVEIQRVRLNTLLNIPVGREVNYVGRLEHIPFTGTLDACLAKAYLKRPDVLMAQKSVAIAEKDQTIARSKFLPDLTASASWATTGNDWDASGSVARPDNYASWSVGLTASLSLFESGSDYFNAQKAGHTINKLQADADSLRQDVIYEVQSRLLELDNAQKRILVARKSVDQASEAYRVAAARYKSQVGTAIDVMDAQARLTSAEVSLTGAQADYLSALAAIYAAIGEENHDLHNVEP